ncbi:hypothetical protein EST38_g13364 [Candolleomyces aberdarensis]|uniref:Uncharacterized protein n=1 Tax=Candolleomyces aberdarensis TaxID=2316362 RepID=A0A4Q2D2E7_9AGAR|nr:hypothetical protein EST38_g13364 [Candolleomyces aberdarensis]
MDEDSSLFNDRGGESQFYLTDIFLNHIADITDGDHSSLRITELVIFGLADEPDGKCFPLVTVFSGRWKIEGSIGLPKIEKGIVIIAKFGERWDMGFTHLDRIDMENGTNGKESGHIRDMKTRDQWPCLTISWEICEIPCEPTTSGEDTQTLLGNIKARRRQVFGPSISVSALWEAIVPPEGAGLLGSLDYLGTCFKRSFERTGALSDSGESISATRRAVELTPAGHPDLPVRLGNFGHSFADRFGRTGALSDIAEAVSALRRSVELTPAGHPDLPFMLNKLGISLLKRFECTGAFSDIVELTLLTRQAVELMPADHPDLPGMLSNLQNLLFSTLRNLLSKDSKRPGALSDISDTISVQQRAVELTPAVHPDLPGRLSKLGNSLLSRFERTGAPSDLSQSILVIQRAVELTPAGHPELHTMLSNLKISLANHFKRTGALSDIAESISVQQCAVELTPAGHPDLPGMLSNLGHLLLTSLQAHRSPIRH